MHTLIIEKATGLILHSRYDNSTGEKMPIAQVLETYCSDTNTAPATVEAIEIPFQKFSLTIGKHIYKDGQISVSPTWVEPVFVPTPELTRAELVAQVEALQAQIQALE